MVMALFAAIITTNAATLKRVPSIGPIPQSAGYAGYIADAKVKLRTTGTLPPGAPTSPTDARMASELNLLGLTATTNAYSYMGNFTAPAPFDHEVGTTLYWWVVYTAVGADETVALAGISGEISTSDPKNLLKKSFDFSVVDTAYSDSAVGYKADGSEINSGPANTQARLVIVPIGSKYGLVLTAKDVYDFVQYFSQFPNWSESFRVTAGGMTVTETLLQGTLAPPKLIALSVGGDMFSLTAVSTNGNTKSYPVQINTDFGDGWASVGVISAGTTNMVQTHGAPILFARIPQVANGATARGHIHTAQPTIVNLD